MEVNNRNESDSMKKIEKQSNPQSNEFIIMESPL